MVKRIIIILILCFSSVSLTACNNEVKKAFEESVAKLEEKNSELENEIISLQTLIDGEEKPLDDSLIEKAKEAIMKAHEAKYLVPEMAKKNDDINTQIQEINSVDYTNVISIINEAKKNLSDSIAQLKLVTNPSEDYVTKKLASIEHVIGIEAATEENDPNGHLHKSGGYTSQVYFESDLVTKSVYGNSIIEKGTDCGGSIEVYESVADAEKRNSYLSGFDGTAFDSGSHEVIGTVIIRTSSLLTATNQRELTEAIKNALTSLD